MVIAHRGNIAFVMEVVGTADNSPLENSSQWPVADRQALLVACDTALSDTLKLRGCARRASLSLRNETGRVLWEEVTIFHSVNINGVQEVKDPPAVIDKP